MGKSKSKSEGKGKGKGGKRTTTATHNHTHVVVDRIGALNPITGHAFQIRVHLKKEVDPDTRSQILSVSGTVVGPAGDQGTTGWIGFDVEWKDAEENWKRLGACRIWWNATDAIEMGPHIALPTRFIDLYTETRDDRLTGKSDIEAITHDLRLLPFKTQVVNRQQRVKTITDAHDVFSVAFSELDHTGVGDFNR